MNPFVQSKGGGTEETEQFNMMGGKIVIAVRPHNQGDQMGWWKKSPKM
jgi:hypothetical protein